MAARKRKAVEAPGTPEAPAGRRRSTRTSSSGKKSKYFESESELEDDLEEATPASKPRNGSTARRKSGGGKRAKVEDDEDDEDAYKDDDNDNDDQDNGNDGEQDEDDEEFDEDAPPKVTFIPIEKMRGDGGVPYADDRIHENTMLFLKDLKANNKRPWLKSHDDEYRRSLKDWESWVGAMTQKMIEIDETIPELPFKDVNFRIYRDIRFSNDPTPYKPHYSAAWSRTGRKGPYACYYVHMEPGKCFVGGGLWHPEGDAVHKLRASIDERPRRWRRVLCDPAFRRTFLPEAKAKKGKGKDAELEDQKAVLKAFAESNKENALKTKPKGFNADHRDIELLKLRNYTIGKKIPDTTFTTESGQAEIAATIEAMVGFVTHLNDTVMPDPNADDDSSEDESE